MAVVISPVPAAIAAARRRILSRFRDQGALSEANAFAYEGKRLIERRQFERMRRAGVIRDAPNGRYWLDEDRAAEWTATRRRRGLIAAAVAMAAAAVAIALG